MWRNVGYQFVAHILYYVEIHSTSSIVSSLSSWRNVGLWRWWSGFHIEDCWWIYWYECVEPSLHPSNATDWVMANVLLDSICRLLQWEVLHLCAAERQSSNWLLLLGPDLVWVVAVLAVWTEHGCVLPFLLWCRPLKSYDVTSMEVW